MEIIESKNASTIIGKSPGFFATQNIDQFISNHLWYAGGIDAVDSNYDVSKPRTIPLTITRHKNGLNFQIDTTLFNKKSIVILDEEITKITFTDSRLLIKKRMGVIGKGLIGGALLGPAGLLLGALKGHSDTSNPNKISSVLLNIYFEKHNKKQVLLLEAGPKAKSNFLSFFEHNYKELLIEEKDDSSSKEKNIDVASEIEKFHKLKESGVLTEEEFENKKKELLSL